MRHFLYLLVIMLLSCFSAEALLPPLWQSIDEIKSMLEQPELRNYLDSADYIESISRIEKGFLITTNKHILEAHIHYLPQDKLGPAHFSWTFAHANITTDKKTLGYVLIRQ